MEEIMIAICATIVGIFLLSTVFIVFILIYPNKRAVKEVVYAIIPTKTPIFNSRIEYSHTTEVDLLVILEEERTIHKGVEYSFVTFPLKCDDKRSYMQGVFDRDSERYCVPNKVLIPWTDKVPIIPGEKIELSNIP